MPTKTFTTRGSQNGYLAHRDYRYSEIAQPGDYLITSYGSDSHTTVTTEARVGPFDYRRAIRNKESATTGMGVNGKSLHLDTGGSLFMRWELDPDYGKQTYVVEAHGTFVREEDLTELDLPSGWNDEVYNLALQRFLGRCQAALRPFQGGVFLGELKETIHAIRHPLSALNSSIFGYFGTANKRLRGIRRSGSRAERLVRVKDVVANTYLEYAFGWKPLVSDIDGALQALVQYNTYREPVVAVRAGASKKYSNPYATHWALGTGSVLAEWLEVHEVNIQMYGAVSCRAGCESDTIRRSIGLTIPDVLPSLWELIPYSFVVDYFTNIGAIIDAACFNTAAVRWWNIATRVESSRTLVVQQYSPFASPNGHEYLKEMNFSSNPPGSISMRKFEMSRSRGISLGVPSLTFRTPFSSDALDTSSRKGQGDRTHILNIGALIAQRGSTRRLIDSIIHR
jgi:hypothetical protein